MSESRRHTLSVDGALLQVHDDGPAQGPCVVLTHSIMTDARMWLPQLAALTSRGFRVLRPESRGHGGSTLGATPLSIDRLALDVVQVMDALGIVRSHYVGLSLGGMVGFALGQQHASRLASLVICDARADSPPAFAQPWDERIAQAQAQGMTALVSSTLARWFGDGLQRLEPQARADLEQAIASTSVEGFCATARALQAFDYTEHLATMPPDTVLIVGGKDGVLPEVMTGLQRSMPQSKLEVIPGVGHLPNVEAPDAFNAVLLTALGACAPL